MDEVTNVSHFLATIEMVPIFFLSGLSFTFDALQILTQNSDKERVNVWERGEEEKRMKKLHSIILVHLRNSKPLQMLWWLCLH